MFEKEAKERARDYTENKERQAAYECGFLDGADRMRGEMQKLKEDNADLKQSLDWANEREKELKTLIEKMKCCENCKYNSYWGNELHCNYGLKEALQEDRLVECKNMDKWEIKK